MILNGLLGQSITVAGTVVDRSSAEPIEFATVMVADLTTGTALAGTTTDLDGNFSIDVTATEFWVEISFIGYEAQRFEDIKISEGRVDLGTIVLSDQSQQLEEVTVRAEKSQTEFKLDKRVFNVGKDLSSTGAGALEVLNNVPSVNVSIEGQISLRGSAGVQILINGKPSVIADGQNSLSTITAEMIDRIEVITNPSAKYDAEGTSGIINIVIKKEERKGLNGAISVNTGTPDNHNIGLSLNRRTEKFNLFSQLGVGYRKLPNDVENINRDLVNNTAITTRGVENRNEHYYNLILGTDYQINDNNVLTLSGNFAYEIEDQPSDITLWSQDATGNEVASWQRTEVTDATNPKWQYELQYKRDFKDHKDHDLIMSALGTYFGKDQSSAFENRTIAGENRSGEQRTATEFQEAENIFKLDYTRPISEQITLETGAQYVLKDVSNDFSVSNLENGVFVADPALTNLFEYQQNVLGVYATGAYELGKWGIKVGARVENTDLRTLLVNTNESNNQNFTNLFPSAHTSYKISDAVSIQAGYSRRVFRPRLWDLNPFFNIRNNFNIRAGNPNLLPEFTDAYEVTSIYLIGEASLNFGIYHRYTTEVVERVSTFADGVNTTIPINTGTNRATGLEFNAKVPVGKLLTFTGDLNYNTFQREGAFDEVVFDFSADQWSGKLTSKVKLPLDFDFEVTGQYQSRVQTVQSIISENVFADLGLRKKLFKGKGALSFSIRDVFASRIQESFTEQPEFSAYSFQQRGRFITLGFSYGFGKGDTMEYSGQRRRF